MRLTKAEKEFLAKQGLKRCAKCKNTKPYGYYSKCKHRKDGYDQNCRECKREKKFKYDYQKATSHDYEKYTSTETCEICDSQFKHDKRKHLDHCHVTKNIRGVLCQHCNMGLGHFFDDPKILLSAIHYLKKHKTLSEYEA